MTDGRKKILIDGRKLASERARRLLSQDELANLSGISVNTIKHLEPMPEKSMLVSTGRRLAEALQIAPSRIAVDQSSTDVIDQSAMVYVLPIPVWEIDISASRWAQVPVAELNYDDPTQRRVIEQGRFRLRIKGQCMEPEYADGSIVEFELLRTESEGPRTGRDYVWCRSDGTATFKRLAGLDEKNYLLVALNQAGFPEVMSVPRHEITRIGKVAWRLTPPPE